jgi:valyl-tRNA synthetase
MYAAMPKAKPANSDILAAMERAKNVIIGVRGVRASKNLSPRDALTLNIIGEWSSELDCVITKLANIDTIATVSEKDPAAASFMVDTTEFNIPLLNAIDVDAELERLNKELAHYEGFLASVNKKLSNERFVNNAPAAVVDLERRKQSDATEKIAAIKASIAGLSK